jgi:hypothetical protein
MPSEIFSALQVALARLGIIAHDHPTKFGAPFGIYLETKLRRMKKHYSISGRIQYIKRQIAEMNVDESDKMQIRHRMINYLCQEISQGRHEDWTNQDRDQFKTLQEEAQEKYFELISTKRRLDR